MSINNDVMEWYVKKITKFCYSSAFVCMLPLSGIARVKQGRSTLALPGFNKLTRSKDGINVFLQKKCCHLELYLVDMAQTSNLWTARAVGVRFTLGGAFHTNDMII